jgi:putative ubiquitin-RnfH superfamily antitoxin RatB of RatAB toxin-antitoxin module
MGLGVEVVYAGSDKPVIKAFRLAAPATVAEALLLAAADPAFAGVDCLGAPVGIYGRIVERAEPLADGDRVEIYRPLAIDPKAARRSRARRSR